MEENIKRYVVDIVKNLESGESVRVENVNPRLLESVLGDFHHEFDINGWECDYWVETDCYEIFGTMYNGTAKITMK